MMDMIGGFIIFSAREKFVFKSRYLCNSQKQQRQKKTSGVVELVARYPASKVFCMHLDSPLIKVQFDKLYTNRKARERNKLTFKLLPPSKRACHPSFLLNHQIIFKFDQVYLKTSTFTLLQQNKHH